MAIDLQIETGAHHLAFAGTEPVIFHCHHYNAVLQQSIEDAGAILDTATLLRDGAASPAYSQMSRLFDGQPFAERLAFAAGYFARSGFGLLDLSAPSVSGGTVRLKNSHYALGFNSRKDTGQRTRPACYFAAGYIEAVLAAAFDIALGSYEVTESQCAALGAADCRFEVKRAGGLASRPPALGKGRVPDPVPARPTFTTSVDEAAILTALAGLPMQGNEEGVIPAFGVYLTRHYANYCNYISYEFERRICERNPRLEGAAHSVLAEAGHVCAFNTFGGIMSSPEWDGLIRPMIKTRTDWVYGITSCINALGWGRWTVLEVADQGRLVMRVDGSYESNYYLAAYGKSSKPQCHFVRGAVAGIMNLLYAGDITSRPALDAEYYDKLFSGPESYRGREILCRSRGDAHCEFEVENVSYR